MKNLTKIFIVLGLLIVGVVFVAQGVFAEKPTGNTRPGWGYGDTNHVHVGPPGQSVRP
jgi:hypothetical protein